MILIKIILKILAVPVMILCKLTLVLGPITLFILGCAIYTIVKHNWSQTFLLALIEASCFAALFGAGVVSTEIGCFGDLLGEFIRS